MSMKSLALTVRCLLVLLVVGWGLSACGAGSHSEPAREGGATEKRKRAIYFVKHGFARTLAAPLTKHFQGEAEVQVLLDGSDNCLLINSDPAILGEVLALVEKLDRPPQTVVAEVILAEVASRKGASEEGLNLTEFTGRAADVLAKVEALRKKGVFGKVRSVRLTTVAGRPISAREGTSTPFTMGTTSTTRGAFTRSISYRDLGTQVEVTANVTPARVVLLDLKLEDTHASNPGEAPAAKNKDEDAGVMPPEFFQLSLTANLSIPSGRAVVAKAVKNATRSGEVETLVIVTARVGETEEKGK